MKQLIKSAIIYSAALPPHEELLPLLQEAQFCEPLLTQVKSAGFVPREDFGLLVEPFPGGQSFTFRVDQKIIPGSVIKTELAKVCRAVERDTGRKPGKKEKAELKMGVIDDLAQRALIRTSLLTCYHHTESNFLIVPTTSSKVAAEAVSALVMAVGSVKMTTIQLNEVSNGLTAKLQAWLVGDTKQFILLTPTNEAVLVKDGQALSVKMGDLNHASEALQESLHAGFRVKSLGLSFANGTVAKLTDEFHLKGIEMFCAQDTGDGEEEEPTFASQASLEVDEVVGVANVLCEMFGYKAEGEVSK